MTHAQTEHDVLEVFQLLQQAVSVAAEDVRFTAYKPADEVGIRYKLHTGNGSQKFVPGPIESYSAGSRLVRALLRTLCGVASEVSLETDPPLATDLLAEWAERLGIKGARVLNSPIRGAGPEGYICVLTFQYRSRAESAITLHSLVRAS
jgi:hypothetical protein